MGVRLFDRKFGPQFLSTVPHAPGVYRYYDPSGALIYVGKARDLRKRLASYRSRSRLKKARKVRRIVLEASRLEFEPCPTHLDACLKETALIQAHRPRQNISGAYWFMYPLLGIRQIADAVFFCYTPAPPLFPEFRFHGAYRSRGVVREAFFALRVLMFYLGRPIAGNLADQPYSYVYGFSRIPAGWVERFEAFLRGDSRQALGELAVLLLARPMALHARHVVQEKLESLKAFWEHEARPLAEARRATGYLPYPVPQMDRDCLFVRWRAQRQTL